MGRPVVMKRPEEVINLKAEKTAEFVVPDLSLKLLSDEEPPPVSFLQQNGTTENKKKPDYEMGLQKLADELEATKVEVAKMSSLVQETVGDLSLAYRDILSASKRTLDDFMVKQELEGARLEKESLELDLAELQRKINSHQQTLLEKEEALRQIDSQKAFTQQSLSSLEAQMVETKNNLVSYQVESENLKVSLDILKGTIERKEKFLQGMGDEVVAYGKRVQDLKNTEVELLRIIHILETSKAVSEGELSGLESRKISFAQSIDEMKHLHEEQLKHFEALKTDLDQRYKTEEERHQLEHQHKVHDWELQFTEHCLTRKTKLTKDLEELSLAHSISLLKLKEGFVLEAKKSVLDILDINEFSSRDERLASMQSAFDTAASKFVLSPIINHSAIWKRAFWCTSLISFTLTALLIWKW